MSSKRAHVLTDASLYAPDGTIIGFEKKAFPVESWTGVITGRGNCWWLHALDIAEAHASFDAFVALSGPIIEREHRAAMDRGDLEGQTIVEVHAIGWSERQDRAKAFVLRSPSPFDDADGGSPPYVWRDLDDGEDGSFYTELSALERWQLHRQGAEPGEDFTAETFDPARHGVPLVEAQRRKGVSSLLGDLAGLHVIGGELWLTVVDREGARQGIIHEWPDRIGEPIRPEPVDESQLRKIPPAGLPWPFERFDRAFRGGAIDPETFALDKVKLAQIEATAPASAGLSRHERRAAKAQAKRSPARV